MFFTLGFQNSIRILSEQRKVTKQSATLVVPKLAGLSTLTLPTLDVRSKVVLSPTLALASSTLKTPTLDIKVPTRVVVPKLSASSTAKTPTLDVRRKATLISAKCTGTASLKEAQVRTQSFVVLAVGKLTASSVAKTPSVLAKQRVTIAGERMVASALAKAPSVHIPALVQLIRLVATSELRELTLRTSDAILLKPPMMLAQCDITCPHIHVYPDGGYILYRGFTEPLSISGSQEDKLRIDGSGKPTIKGTKGTIKILGGNI